MQLNFSPFPVLTTERLILRKMTTGDAPEMLFLRSDPGVLRYIDREPAKTIEEVIAFIDMVNGNLDSGDGINWAITLRDDPKLLGNICFWNVQKEHYRAELGYVLHPSWQGKGIMNEAMQAVLHYGFNDMKLHSVEANVNPENIPSVRVLERYNFVREGYFRENYYFNGRFIDSAIYSLLTSVK